MNIIYKFLLKKDIYGKNRNIYIKIKSKSKKQYLKYKGKMMNLVKYRKMKMKKATSATFSKSTKKKGGYGGFKIYKSSISIEEKLQNFIDSICDDNLYDLFMKKYIIIKNRRESQNSEIKSEEEHFKFLTAILIYIEKSYDKESGINSKTRSTLEKLTQLLFTLEQEGITGIYSYNNLRTNPYIITDSTHFYNIMYFIDNFINKERIVWNFFENGYRHNNDKSNRIKCITISNTHVVKFIKSLLHKNGLNIYYPRYKPY